VSINTVAYKNLRKMEEILLRLSTNPAYFNLSKPPSRLTKIGVKRY
jgi:hypothetical protein